MSYRITLIVLTLVWAFALPVSASAQDLLVTSIVAPPVGIVVAGEADRSLTQIQRVEESRAGLMPALYGSYITLQLFDGYTTIAGTRLSAGESNPLMRGLVDHPAMFWTVKGAVTAATVYTAERLWRDHRRREAIAVMVVCNAIVAGVSLRNISVLRGRP